MFCGSFDSCLSLFFIFINITVDPMPRWARVNLLKNTYKEIEEELINEGFTCIMRRQEVEKLVEDKDAETIR